MERRATPERIKARRLFLLALLFFFLYLAFLLLRPYLGTLVFAVVLASIFQPLHRRLLRGCKGRKNLAAFLTATLLVGIVVIPLLGFALALVHQGVESLGHINGWLQAGNLDRLLAWEKIAPLRQSIDQYLGLLGLEHINLQKVLLNVSARLGHVILSRGTELVGNATGLFVRFLLLVVSIFYLCRDGQRLLGHLQRLSPLTKEQEERLIERVRTLSSSVALANLGTAVAQGGVGAIGLWFCGIPALFWGTLMAFASLIPTIGTALVWLPAAGYLLLTGSWGKAIFLCLWCLLLVGAIDNFLRPLLMKGQGSLSSVYLFFAIIGGIHFFGLAGILYGPLIFGISAVLFYLYEMEYQEVLQEE